MSLKILAPLSFISLLFISACEDMGEAVPPITPVINSVVPDSGAAGDTITINGTNFGVTQGSSSVKFGSITATEIVSWSNTEVRVKVPANSTTANVTVAVGSSTSNSAQFKIIGAIATVSFATDILQNIFNKNSYGCTRCHGGTNSLFLTSYSSVMAGNSVRGPVVVAGDTSSLLIRKLKGGTFLGPSEGVRMPQSSNPIADSDLRNVVTWIKEGAQNN